MRESSQAMPWALEEIVGRARVEIAEIADQGRHQPQFADSHTTTARRSAVRAGFPPFPWVYLMGRLSLGFVIESRGINLPGDHDRSIEAERPLSALAGADVELRLPGLGGLRPQRSAPAQG